MGSNNRYSTSVGVSECRTPLFCPTQDIVRAEPVSQRLNTHPIEGGNNMKRAIYVTCLCLTALFAVGCTKKTGAMEATADLTPTPKITAQPTPEPTPVPTQMPLMPLSKDAFSAVTAKDAAAQIRAALSRFPCYTVDHEIGTYADFVSYDEAHDSVRVRLERGTERALLNALSPLTEAGKLTRLMLEQNAGATVLPMRGVTELILTTLDSDAAEWLAGFADVTSLTICDTALGETIAYPQHLQSLTLEGDYAPLTELIGTPEDALLPELTSLSVGSPEDEELEAECETGIFGALPKLTTLNLWLAPGEEAQELYRQVLSIPTLQTLNGLAKSTYGAYYGLDVSSTMDALAAAASAANEEAGNISATSGLPAEMAGDAVYVRMASESSSNLEGDGYVTSDSMEAEPGEFYGIPRAMLWQDGMSQRHVWVAYIYEYDEITGYYGDKENEIWGYAAETRLLAVDTSTGQIFKATAKRTSPPATNEEDTYGDYCPLTAVEQLRTRLKTELGPYAGCSLEETVGAVKDNLAGTGKTFATEGMPPAITGPLYVEIASGDGNCADVDNIVSTTDATQGLDYYGIPYERIYQNGSLESATWVAIIAERDVVSRTYSDDYSNTEGYSVETHLTIVDLATGRAWHRIVVSSPPPSTPDETNYGSFFPNKAVVLLKPLIH